MAVLPVGALEKPSRSDGKPMNPARNDSGSTAVSAVCNELITEAEAILKYTSDLELIQDGAPKVTKTFEDIRLDELEHLQNLTLALTELLGGEEEGGEGAE